MSSTPYWGPDFDALQQTDPEIAAVAADVAGHEIGKVGDRADPREVHAVIADLELGDRVAPLARREHEPVRARTVRQQVVVVLMSRHAVHHKAAVVVDARVPIDARTQGAQDVV